MYTSKGNVTKHNRTQRDTHTGHLLGWMSAKAVSEVRSIRTVSVSKVTVTDGNKRLP
ncbi:hypothetical protein HanIR_Chr01g0007541 [Helianthus annuus]|nr:hypothetical protein HanIR_Chr01g0007541 [Helianthus annuus]